MKIAVYAGSFDPVTKGHLDIINRSAKLFDKLIIAILKNSNKKYWFDLEERKELILKCISPETNNIEIKSFNGLLVDFMKENEAEVLVRGLRAVSDYEYELQLALTNSVLAEQPIETIFLTASRENLYLSASIVKDVALNNGKLEEFLNKNIISDVQKRAKNLLNNK